MAIHATIAIGENRHHFGVGVNDPGAGPDEPRFSQVPMMSYQYIPSRPARQERQVVDGKPRRYNTGQTYARLVCQGRYGAPTAGAWTPLIQQLKAAQRDGTEITWLAFPEDLVETAWLVESFASPCTAMENGVGIEYSYTLHLVEA